MNAEGGRKCGVKSIRPLAPSIQQLGRFQARGLCTTQRAEGTLQTFRRRRDNFDVMYGHADIRYAKAVTRAARNATCVKPGFSSLTLRLCGSVQIQLTHIKGVLKDRLTSRHNLIRELASLNLCHGSALVCAVRSGRGDQLINGLAVGLIRRQAPCFRCGRRWCRTRRREPCHDYDQPKDAHVLNSLIDAVFTATSRPDATIIHI